MITEVTQVWRARRASYRPVGEVFDPRAHEVVETRSDTLIKAFVAEHHYLVTTPPLRRRFCLYRGAEVVGVCAFTVPSQYAVLGRLVLLDDVRANAESWFVRRALEVLRREGWSGVVTFADPVHWEKVPGALRSDLVVRAETGILVRALARTYGVALEEES